MIIKILQQMKNRFLKLKDWLLMSLMGTLGMAGCHSPKDFAKEPVAPEPDSTVSQPDPRERAVLMYGVPTMDFVLKGRVIDAQGNPVSGMQVVLVNGTVDITPDNMQDDNEFVRDYINSAGDTTNAEGVFECQMRDVPNEMQHVIVRDVDGSKNGEYESQMLEVNFAEGEAAGTRRGWYMGTRIKDVDITVKKVRK